MKKINYNYNNYQDDLSAIVYAIEKANIKYDVVVGVVRGGLVPAVHLSHILDATFIPLSWSSSVLEKKEKNNTALLRSIVNSQKILIVDDICDSGVSLDEITKIYRNVHTAVLIHNEINIRGFTPTYYGWKINRNETPDWFDFWWEKK